MGVLTEASAVPLSCITIYKVARRGDCHVGEETRNSGIKETRPRSVQSDGLALMCRQTDRQAGNLQCSHKASSPNPSTDTLISPIHDQDFAFVIGFCELCQFLSSVRRWREQLLIGEQSKICMSAENVARVMELLGGAVWRQLVNYTGVSLRVIILFLYIQPLPVMSDALHLFHTGSITVPPPIPISGISV
ncbi:hypothetical protein J6590_016592 [Homalodisca vitripennis]|nr:hypothetical protein J6590_016592 [Homalodisca vitripennis]